MLGRLLRNVAIASVATALVAIGVSTPSQAQPPQAPVKLRAIPAENPIDPSQPLIRLRWQRPTTGTAPTAYKVFVNGELFETTRGTQANITPLQLGAMYTFEVKAIAATGASQSSQVQRMAVIAPSEPLNLDVVPDDRSLYVAWDAPLSTGGGPIASYVVRTSSFRPGPQPPCEAMTPTSCKISGLTNGVHYDVTVQARNSAGNFLPGTDSLPAIGIPNFRPSGPREFRIIAAGSTTATLAWDPPQHVDTEPILGYTISLFNNEGYWFPNQAPEYPQINVGPDVRSFRLTGLAPGLPYQFGVQAYTDVAPGAMTVNTLHNPLGLPSKPALVEVTGVGNTTVNLAWEDGSPNGGIEPSDYRLTATPVNPPPGVLPEQIECPVKASQALPDLECAGEYLWMRLINGVTYSFTVATKNKFGWGPTSNYPAFATPEGPPPPPLITAAAILSPTNVVVTWDASATSGGPNVGAITYTVTLDGAPVCRGVTVTTCAITGLVPYQNYDVRVTAINVVFGGDDFSSTSLIVNTNPIQAGTP